MLKYFFITWFFLILCLIIADLIFPSIRLWKDGSILWLLLLLVISFLPVLLFDLYNDFGSFGFVIFFILVIIFFMLFQLPDIRTKNYSIEIGISSFLLFLLFTIFFTLSGYTFKDLIINM
jgi:hypothetical protein